MNRHLRALDNNSVEHANVGFILRNTTSRNGSVSRAIVKSRWLSPRWKRTKHLPQRDSIYTQVGDEEILLSGNEYVSMNFFGFSVTALPFYEEYFKSFLKSRWLPQSWIVPPESTRFAGLGRCAACNEQWLDDLQEDRELLN